MTAHDNRYGYMKLVDLNSLSFGVAKSMVIQDINEKSHPAVLCKYDFLSIP